MRKILHTLFLLNIISISLYSCSSNNELDKSVNEVNIPGIEAQTSGLKAENGSAQPTEQQLKAQDSDVVIRDLITEEKVEETTQNELDKAISEGTLKADENGIEEDKALVAEALNIEIQEQEIDSSNDSPIAPSIDPPNDPSNELALDSFFKKWTSAGKVDYNSLQNEETLLIELKTKTAAVKLNELSEGQKKAFYINAYNFLVIAQVVDNLPIGSPLDVAGFFKETLFDVGGEKLTLSELEAKVSSDNRTHFVLVCAAKGCPIIQSSAFFGDKLEGQLEAQTRKALNDPDFIRGSGRQTLLSKIFEWYADDFGGQDAFVSYLNRYRNEQLLPDYKINYYEYDWTLNSK